MGHSGGLFAQFVSDFVGKLLKLCLLKLDPFAFEIFHNVLAGVFTFFRGEKESYCGTCYGTSYYCEHNV